MTLLALGCGMQTGGIALWIAQLEMILYRNRIHAIVRLVLLFQPWLGVSSSALGTSCSPPKSPQTPSSISRNEMTTVSVEPNGVSTFSNDGINCSCRWLERALFAPLLPMREVEADIIVVVVVVVVPVLGSTNMMLLRGCRAAAAIGAKCLEMRFLSLSWSSVRLAKTPGAALAKSGRMGGMEMQTMLMVHSRTLQTSGSAIESGGFVSSYFFLYSPGANGCRCSRGGAYK